MLEPAKPENEDARLAALRGMSILDTAPEDSFDSITRVAAQLFGVTTALITLVDEKRYPWDSLAALYRRRWQVEIYLRTLNSLYCFGK